MRSLIRKELRSLLPFILLLAFLACFDLATELATDPPDQRTIASIWGDYFGGSMTLEVVFFVFSFALAQGLLVRETEDRAIEFLDALPVTRTQVFWVKAASGYATLLLLSLGPAATLSILHLWSLNSLEPSFRLRAIAVAAGLQCFQIFVFFSFGLALSFFRRFAWAAAGLAFWGYIALLGRYPEIRALNPFAIADTSFIGGAPFIPWRMIAIQGAASAAALAAAWAIFAGAAEGFQRRFDAISRHPAGVVALAGGAALIVIAWGAALVYLADQRIGEIELDEDERAAVAAKFADWSVSRALTERYTFIYPAQMSDKATKLIAEADAIHDKVAAFLGEPAGVRIEADLTGASEDHAGLAYWNKLRMSLTASEDPAVLAAILGHETTHIFQERIGKERYGSSANATRFFNEGLASYVEHRIDGSGEDSPLLFMAATARARKEADFEEMIDNAAFCAKRDTNLIYGLGEAFVAGLVRLHGEGAPRAILQAFGRDDAPEGLDGMELWRDAFQSAGYDLDSAIDEFYAYLDAWAKKRADEIASLPRLRAQVAAEHDVVALRIDEAAPEGWHLVCRFRQGKRTHERDYIYGQRRGDGLFTVPRRIFRGSTVWYQAGLTETDGIRAIYEPWALATLGEEAEEAAEISEEMDEDQDQDQDQDHERDTEPVGTVIP